MDGAIPVYLAVPEFNFSWHEQRKRTCAKRWGILFFRKEDKQRMLQCSAAILAQVLAAKGVPGLGNFWPRATTPQAARPRHGPSLPNGGGGRRARGAVARSSEDPLLGERVLSLQSSRLRQTPPPCRRSSAAGIEE